MATAILSSIIIVLSIITRFYINRRKKFTRSQCITVMVVSIVVIILAVSIIIIEIQNPILVILNLIVFYVYSLLCYMMIKHILGMN